MLNKLDLELYWKKNPMNSESGKAYKLAQNFKGIFHDSECALDLVRKLRNIKYQCNQGKTERALQNSY